MFEGEAEVVARGAHAGGVPQRLAERPGLLVQLARPPIVPRAVVAVPEAAVRLGNPRAVPQRLADRPVLLVQLARLPIVPRLTTPMDVR